jgi:putative ABC transport system substrate-binding protein
MMRLTGLIVILALVLAASLTVEAPPAGKVARMGYLSPGTVMTSAGTRQAFTDGLRHHGWIEGQNLAIEYRWTEGRYERLPDLAADLARLPLDAIFAVNTPTALAMQRTGTTLPVVFAVVSEPVEIGLVESLPRPGCRPPKPGRRHAGGDAQLARRRASGVPSTANPGTGGYREGAIR